MYIFDKTLFLLLIVHLVLYVITSTTKYMHKHRIYLVLKSHVCLMTSIDFGAYMEFHCLIKLLI